MDGASVKVILLLKRTEQLQEPNLQVSDGCCGMQVWNCANYNLVGSMPSSMEARSLVVSADLIYLGSRNGAVEIWSREKLTRIGTLQAGGPSCRVQCMAVDGDGDVLVVGTSDGRIQVKYCCFGLR